MKIGIYTPYLDTIGGGEKYMMTIAKVLSQKSEVIVLLDQHLASLDIDQIVKRIEDQHGIDLSKVQFTKAPIGKEASLIKKTQFLKNFDWLFYNTDGSLFLSTAKKSILHFQMPLENSGARGIRGTLKLRSWKGAIYNSKFTQEFIEKSWPIRGQVVYPPVSVNLFTSLKKKKQIVSVGRFVEFTKVKKHEVMIRAFQEMIDQKKLKGWSLHLAGGVAVGDEDYLKQLQAMSSGYDIVFYPNLTLEKLKVLYGESSIYWHAMGYGEEDPKKMEHFGITTVEAMASGCVPVVINKGGQKEIVEDGQSGFLWDDLDQLKNTTERIANDANHMQLVSEKAQERSKQFALEKFQEKLYNLVYGHN